MTVGRTSRSFGWALVSALLAGCGGKATPIATTPAPAHAPAAVTTAATAPDTGKTKTPAGADSVAAVQAAVDRDQAADQRVLDTLQQGLPDSSRRLAVAASSIPREDVRHEAERLFGPDKATAPTAGPKGGDATFDIDVSTFSGNSRVLQYLDFFQTDAHDRFEIWIARLGRYEGMIRERLRAKGLPEDLVYLTVIESGLSNTAVSRTRAVGMWQFMAGTARNYGLTVDPWMDERRDPFKATDAAANYLSDLMQRLGSVYLAAAAYDAGAGKIERTVARLPGEVDSLTDQTFFDIASRKGYLRRETRDYVPKLIAASLIAKQPIRYGFTGIDPMAPLVFDEITVPDATGLDVIARLSDTTVATILELNPQFIRGITPPGREVTVRVPRGRGQEVALRYDSLPASDRVTFVDHYVTRGQTVSGIAQRYHVTVAMITAANPHTRLSTLHIGERIIIPMSGRVVPSSAWSVPPEHRSRTRTPVGVGAHRVAKGETVTSIARHYGVPLAVLLDYNDLEAHSVLHVGTVIRIPPKQFR
ncbi:MAG TPA: transglycosylase SLT domain-containing protein [Gemmatimonadales bacterium]|nr:transglycosylase SLT domain-containing protein [Gemmatimonadales bacterium]